MLTAVRGSVRRIRWAGHRAALLPLAVLCAGVALLPAPGPVAAQDPELLPAEVELPPLLPSSAPLFQSQEPLRLRLEGELGRVLDERGDDPEEFPGTVVVVEADGSETSLPAQLRTRGKFRLNSRTCDFPPIRLNFPVSRVEGSVFEGQDKIKLVTHCRDSERYRNNVQREYLVYRLFNVVNPLASLNVRLARVTYVDTVGERDPVEAWAFLIEMEEAAAERLGGDLMSDEELEAGLHPSRILNPEAIRVTLFQYMIGNTDFSMYGDRGMPPHNVIPVRRARGSFIPLPYDFDFSGLVNAPYARPDPSLGIRNVRQRVFRGLCRPGMDYASAYRDFQELRPGFERVIREEGFLPDEDREEMLEYLEEFWETLGNEGRRERRIERSCRRV